MFVDDAKITADGATVERHVVRGRPRRLDGAGRARGQRGQRQRLDRTPSVGFVDGPGVATDHSLYWGFGLEGVTDAAKRATLIRRRDGHCFGVH